MVLARRFSVHLPRCQRPHSLRSGIPFVVDGWQAIGPANAYLVVDCRRPGRLQVAESMIQCRFAEPLPENFRFCADSCRPFP